jgi:hypothetical protein
MEPWLFLMSYQRQWGLENGLKSPGLKEQLPIQAFMDDVLDRKLYGLLATFHKTSH